MKDITVLGKLYCGDDIFIYNFRNYKIKFNFFLKNNLKIHNYINKKKLIFNSYF
jgi:hypothetical protein